MENVINILERLNTEFGKFRGVLQTVQKKIKLG